MNEEGQSINCDIKFVEPEMLHWSCRKSIGLFHGSVSEKFVLYSVLYSGYASIISSRGSDLRYQHLGHVHRSHTSRNVLRVSL